MSAQRQSVIAVTALVVAILGWTPVGEAAREAVFPPNSVGSAQLKANAVVTAKIRNGAVTAADLQRRAVTGAHVRPGTLLASHFRAGQLPAGAKGEKGDKGDRGAKGDRGDKGEPGLSAYQIVVSANVALPANGTALARVTCPAGKKPIGGGGHVFGAVAGAGYLSSSIPIGQTQWQAAYKSTGLAATIQAYAICAVVAP